MIVKKEAIVEDLETIKDLVPDGIDGAEMLYRIGKLVGKIEAADGIDCGAPVVAPYVDVDLMSAPAGPWWTPSDVRVDHVDVKTSELPTHTSHLKPEGKEAACPPT